MNPELKPFRVLVIAGNQMRDDYVIDDAWDFGDIVALLKIWGIPFDILRLDQHVLEVSDFQDGEGNTKYGTIIWTARQDQYAWQQQDDDTLKYAVESLDISLIAVGNKIQEPILQKLLGLTYQGFGNIPNNIEITRTDHFITRDLPATTVSATEAFLDGNGPQVAELVQNVELLAQAGHWPQATARTVNIATGTRAVWLGGHPDIVFDSSPVFVKLLQRSLIWSIGYAVYKDYGQSIILRLDDPGNAQNVYLTHWQSVTLSEETIQAELITPLQNHNARVSLMFIPGFPWIPTQTIERSVTIDFVDYNGLRQNYKSMYQGLLKGIAEGVIDIEVHGLTHQAPDLSGWWEGSPTSEWPDTSWYREFYDVYRDADIPGSVQYQRLTQALDWIEEDFSTRPLVFTPSGHVISGEYYIPVGNTTKISDDYTYKAAAKAGLGLASAWNPYYLGPDYIIRLDTARANAGNFDEDFQLNWMEDSLALDVPAVFYFHDRDLDIPSRTGNPGQLDRWLNEMEAKFGNVYYMTFAEWTAYLHTKIELTAPTTGSLQIEVSCLESYCRYFDDQESNWTLHLSDELLAYYNNLGRVDIVEDGQQVALVDAASYFQEQTQLTVPKGIGAPHNIQILPVSAPSHAALYTDDNTSDKIVETTPPQSQPTVTQEIHYHNPYAGEVSLVWGINGWLVVPDEARPAGTVVKKGVMYTPMSRENDTFIARLQVPAGATIDLGFWITKTDSGVPIEVWDNNEDQQIIATADNVTQIYPATPVLQNWIQNILNNIIPHLLIGIGVVLGSLLILRRDPAKISNKIIMLTLFGLIGLGLILRLALVNETGRFFQTPVQFVGDEDGYDYLATALLRGEFFQWPGRTPIYPLFLAAFYLIFNYNYPAVLYTQAIVAITAIPLTYRLGRQFTDQRASLVAAMLVAVIPTLLYQTTSLYTEAIYTPLLLFSILCLLKALETPRLHRFIWAGLLLGVTTLTRPATALMPFALPLILPFAWSLRRRVAAWVLYTGAMITVIVPWTYHNYLTYDKFMPFSVSGVVLWHGSPEFYHLMKDHTLLQIWEKYLDPNNNGGHDPFTIEGDSYFTSRAIESIRSEPGVYAWYSLQKPVFFWVGHPAADWDWPFNLRALFKYYSMELIIVLIWTRLLFLLAAVVGLIILLWRRSLWSFLPLLVICAYFMAVHAISYADSRYSGPLYPILAVFIATAAVEVLGRYQVRSKVLPAAPVVEASVPQPVPSETPLNPAHVWIVVPAYNEDQVIAQVLQKLTKLPYNIVVVDDGSSDDTAQQIQQFPVVFLRHICNLGQGAALQTGISYALRFKETEFVVTFDSDGQHNDKDIARMLEPLQSGTYDVVLGSRFLREGDMVNIEARKQLFLKLAVAITKFSTGLKLTDTHNGLRAFTASAASKLNLTENRMAHASEILARIAGLNLQYTEVPVTITYTSYSVSKGQTIFNSINIMWDSMTGKIR